MKLFTKHQAGFTLVELLLYLGLVAIFLTVMSTIFLSTLEVHTDASSASDVIEDGQYIMARLAYDIKRADEILAPAVLGSSATSMQLSIGGQTHVYSLQNGNLELFNHNGTFSLNSQDTEITSLSFTRLGNLSGRNSIDISLEVTSKMLETTGRRSEQFNIIISLR